MKFLSAHVNTEPTWRGGEQQTLYLLQGLRRRGYPVLLFAAPGTPLYARARGEGFETYGLTIRSEADFLASLRMAKLLKELQPAILHLHTSHAHTIGVCAAWLSGNGMKKVVSRRVNFSIYRHSFFGLNWIKYRYGVHRYLTVSESVRDVLVRDGVEPDRIRVVYSGVDPERFRDASSRRRAELMDEWQLPQSVPLVGSIGALVPYKGFLYVVEAAAAVLKRRDCAFVIVGEGELYGALQGKIRELGIEHRFRLLGFRSDIGDILSALDVFVFPSLEEGLGTSLLDAMLLGRPTIATRAGGIPEVLCHRRNGILVDAGDSTALAAGIDGLLSDPGESQRLAAAGSRTVLESFSADRMVEKTLEAYHEVLG